MNSKEYGISERAREEEGWLEWGRFSQLGSQLAGCMGKIGDILRDVRKRGERDPTSYYHYFLVVVLGEKKSLFFLGGGRVQRGLFMACGRRGEAFFSPFLPSFFPHTGDQRNLAFGTLFEIFLPTFALFQWLPLLDMAVFCAIFWAELP